MHVHICKCNFVIWKQPFYLGDESSGTESADYESECESDDSFDEDGIESLISGKSLTEVISSWKAALNKFLLKW